MSTDETPTGFAPYQSDACEESPKPIPIKEICRDCKPDPKFIEPNWKIMVDKPYFNKKTCEYMVTVHTDKFGEQYGLSANFSMKNNFGNFPPGPKRDEMLRNYVQPALVLMLEHFNKLVADQIICAFHNGPALNGLEAEELLTNYNDYKTVFELLKDEPVGEGRHYPDVTPCLDYTKPVKSLTSGDAEASLLSLTDIILQSKNRYPEVTNPYALELYAYVKDFWVDPQNNLLKVSIAIPSFVFDSVPSAPTTDEIEEESTKLESSVELQVDKLFGQITRLSSALKTYAKYQSHFHQSQQGKIIYKDSKKPYYAIDYSRRIDEFYKRLKGVGKNNGWNLRSNLKSVSKLNARLIKIEFEEQEVQKKATPEAIEEIAQEIDNREDPEITTTETAEGTTAKIPGKTQSSPPKKHYRIKSIKVKKRGCEFVKLKGGGVKKFIRDYNSDPTLVGYIAKLNKIDVDLQAKKSYPWMDFLVKFTYPTLSIRYGELSIDDVEETAGSCIAENLAEFGMDLQDYVLNEVLSILEVFQYEWNSKNCVMLHNQDKVQELADTEPEKIYWKTKKNPTARDAKKNYDDTKRKEDEDRVLQDLYDKKESTLEQIRATTEKIKILDSRLELAIRELNESSNLMASTYSYSEQARIEKFREKLTQAVEKEANLRQQLAEIENKLSKRNRDKEISKKRRKTGLEARKQRRAEDHPYVREAKKLAYAEFNLQDDVITSLLALDTFQKSKQSPGADLQGGDNDEVAKISSRLSLCGLDSLLLTSLRCLMSGVEEEAAFKKIIKTTLKAMEIDVFGYFVESLPPTVQQELREKLNKNFEGLPLPWEEGYDAGAMDKTNPYTEYLKSPPERLEEKQNKVRRSKDKVDAKIIAFEEEAEFLGEAVKLAQESLDEWDQYIEGWVGSPEREKLIDESGRLTPEGLSIDTDMEQEFQRRKSELEKAKTELETHISGENLEEAVKDEKTRTELEVKWAELTSDERVKAAELASDATRINMGGDPDKKGSPGTYGTALGNAQELITDAYIEYLLDVMQFDQIMTILDGFPGARIVPFAITQAKCASQGMFKPPIKSFLSSLSLDTCGAIQAGLTFPSSVKPIPNFFKGNYLLVRLRNLFIKKISEALIQIVKGLLIKIFSILDDALCKGLGIAGQAALGGDTLGDALADAFCPNGDDDDLRGAGNGMMNAAGLPPDSWECLYNLLNTILSKQDYINLLTNTPQEMDQRTLNIIAESVKVFCPDFADVLGTPEQVGDLFAAGGNLLPPNIKDNLKQPEEPDQPLYNNICLTKDQYEDWRRSREKLYTDQGLDSDTAKDIMDKANDRALDDIGTLADALNDLDGLLGQALNKLLQPAATAAAADCAVDETALVFEDEKLAEDKLEALNSIFDQLQRRFNSDLIGRPRSFLNNVLRDSNNARLRGHELRVSLPILFANYVNDMDQWRFREENGSLLYTWQMRKMGTAEEDRAKGMFPETVGIWMKEQLEKEKLVYKSGTGPQISMKFSDNGAGDGEPNWSFELKYYVKRVDKSVKRIAAVETYVQKPSAMNILMNPSLESLRPTEVKNKILDIDSQDFVDVDKYYDFQYSDSKSFQALLFESFLKSKVGTELNTNGTRGAVFNEINSSVLNVVRNLVLEKPGGGTPTGFNFGYDFQQAITFADLTYVNPDATSDESTWEYTYENEDGVLGKSATDNPRVHFLDPALHGGSYKRPRIYIEPATYNGWLGMIKVFIPEERECEEMDLGFLNVKSLAKRAKEVERKLPFDERLSLSPDCRFEPPYDKISSPETHGIMEATVLATLRIYATEFVLRALPTFGSVAFSQNNIDGTLTQFVMSEMKNGMIDQTSRFNIVQSFTYYLLFLEQIVQVVQRQVKDGLLEKTDAITAAFDQINSTQRNYDYLNKRELIKGTAIIAFGPYWKKELREKGVDLDDEKTYKKISLKIARMLSPFKINLAAKIASIYDSMGTAEVIAGEMLKKEISDLVKKIDFNLRPRPHIYDIRKSLLSRAGIVLGSTLKSGETDVEQPVFEGQSGIDYGSVPHVRTADDSSHPLNGMEISVGSENLSTPEGVTNLDDFFAEGSSGILDDVLVDVARATLENTTVSLNPRKIKESLEAIAAATKEIKREYADAFISDKLNSALSINKAGFFYLEKYLRVFEKTQDGTLGSSQVYNIKEFQEILKNRDYDPSSYISDNFGNASLVLDEEDLEKVDGTIGIKFGVRLVYSPPSQFSYEQTMDTERERTYSLPPAKMIAKTKPSFKKMLENFPLTVQEGYLNELSDSLEVQLASSTRAIPVVVYEKDILDRKISEIDLEDDDFGEDLKCYVDNLTMQEDFDFLFDVCFPSKPYVSLMAIYSYYCFIHSIGEDVGDTESHETDEDAKGLANDAWKAAIFKKSKKAARKLFNATYRTDDDVKEEGRREKKDRNVEFLKNLLPNSYINIDSSVRWWQKWRIIDISPFDKDGNECKNDFQKMFDGA
tara:strand:+ start:10019 stop:17419 length:7401 start_codon:yes stop_codon:yes gene_type:complete